MGKSAVFVIVALVIAAGGFVGFTSGSSKAASYEIEYKVDCSSCKVVYRDANGEQKEEEVKTSWSTKFTGNAGNFVYVGTRNSDGDAIKVAILENGQEKFADQSEQKHISARAGYIL